MTVEWLKDPRVRPRALAALAAAIAFVRLASSAGWSAAAESIPAASSAGTVAIPIEGMTCASCAAHVKKALRAVDGVTDVEVSLEHRIARVRYTADKVKPEDLVGAINRLGYKAGPPTVADDAP
jgi:copper chaperone CopZ